MNRLAFIMCMVCAPLGWAQEMPVWRQTSQTPGQIIPVFGGGMSAFGLSAPIEVIANTPEGTVDEADILRQQELALQQAKQWIEPKKALIIQNFKSVQGLTNGARGLKVLVNGDWVGEGEKLPLRYQINSATRAALQAVQTFNPQQAATLAQKLEKSKDTLEAQQALVKAIDPKTNTIRISGPLGEVSLPLSTKTP